MKEFRALLLTFFAIIATRLASEAASCHIGLEASCGGGALMLVPFILSVYFIDSLFEDFIVGMDKKHALIASLFCLPYVAFALFVVVSFFQTISVVTIEYILSFNLIYVLLVFIVVYWLNTHDKIRRLNRVFMITFILSVLAFQLF